MIEPTKWHFTLAFLGEVELENIPALTHLLERAAERPPKGQFIFTNYQTFPVRNPSYIVARALPEPADEWNAFIGKLRDMVSVAAPNVDRKPWLPHVSVARVRKGTPLPGWEQPIEPFRWTPKEITLVKSELNREGSSYTDLHVIPIEF